MALATNPPLSAEDKFGTDTNRLRMLVNDGQIAEDVKRRALDAYKATYADRFPSAPEATPSAPVDMPAPAPGPAGLGGADAPITPTDTSPVSRFARTAAPIIGQVGLPIAVGAMGAASPLLLGLAGLVGGIGGSAVQRGGMPTGGDVATAAVGESLPLLGPAFRGVAKWVSPAMAERMGTAASRFGIPLGMGEAASSPTVRAGYERLFQSPMASRFLGKAGAAQSEAIAQAVGRVAEKFGGELPALEFGSRARRNIMQTVRRLSPGKGEQVLASAKALAGDTVRSASLAEAVAKNPEALADVMRTVGQQGMQDLGAAWLTAAAEGATIKEGLRAGQVSGPRLAKAWNALGAEGQTRLYGNRAPYLRQFFDTLGQAKASELAGKATHFPHYFRWEIPSAALGLAHGYGTEAATILGAQAAAPWVAAHMLAAGPPSAIMSLLVPATERAVTQTAGQAVNE